LWTTLPPTLCWVLMCRAAAVASALHNAGVAAIVLLTSVTSPATLSTDAARWARSVTRVGLFDELLAGGMAGFPQKVRFGSAYCG
jgi:hypothetical protein